jgi:hypothetical protein
MKKCTAVLLLLATMYSSKAQKINDPNAEVRIAKEFHGISVGHSFDVYLSQGNEEAVAVSAAEAKDRERITVEVKNGILYIGLDKGWKWNSGNRKLKAYISFKKLDKLDISGACDVLVAGSIASQKLEITQSGASDLKGKLEVQELSVDLSGASDINVSGAVASLTIEASGASNFKGYDLVTQTCLANASGASDIKVTVSKEMNASASGASDIRYKGDAVIKKNKVSGSSSVSRG